MELGNLWQGCHSANRLFKSKAQNRIAQYGLMCHLFSNHEGFMFGESQRMLLVHICDQPAGDPQ